MSAHEFHHCEHTPLGPPPIDTAEQIRQATAEVEKAWAMLSEHLRTTWHLVHRPDPDAEAVEALAKWLHDDEGGCLDPYGTRTCISTSEYYRDKAKRIIEFQRRAEP